MDPVTVVMAALAAGAAAGTTNAASIAVTDAYQGLKDLVLVRLRNDGIEIEEGLRLIDTSVDQPIESAALVPALAAVGVDDLIYEAAQRLLALVEKQPGKFVVDASQAKGLIVGDHGIQHNSFN